MSLSHNTNSPDTLDILLKKVRAIHAVNGESLAHIQTCKSKNVITSQTYTVQEKQKRDEAEYLNIVVQNKRTKAVDNIIVSWSYNGEPLTKESIVVINFIDRRLKIFGDLIRLHNAYDSLIEIYSRLLVDQPVSHAAVASVLQNMELMQVAIGEIHVQTISVQDTLGENEILASFLDNMSDELKTLKTNIPSMNVNVHINDKVSKKENQYPNANFHHVERLSCKKVLKPPPGYKFGEMESVILHGNPFIAVAVVQSINDSFVQLWDLRKNKEF